MCQQGKGEFAFIVAEPWLAASKVPEKKSRGVQSLARDALHILNVRSLKVWLGRRHEPHVETQPVDDSGHWSIAASEVGLSITFNVERSGTMSLDTYVVLADQYNNE